MVEDWDSIVLVNFAIGFGVGRAVKVIEVGTKKLNSAPGLIAFLQE
jgi:hypothetical protein